MWYIYTGEYYSAIKRNKTGSFVDMGMKQESVIQNEISQKETNTNEYIQNLQKRLKKKQLAFNHYFKASCLFRAPKEIQKRYKRTTQVNCIEMVAV